MVVGLIARIRNLTSRSFHLVLAGDPFYAPKVAGEPCVEDVVEIPPGFDEPVEGVVVPWAATSRCGLVVGEGSGHAANPSELIRCVVGPSENDGGSEDWLRLHEDSWEPIAQERWLALGRRHLLGAIGREVELTLTFRERRSCPGDNLEQAPWLRVAFSVNFEREAASAPPNTVFLNVYDLASAASIPNSVLCNTLVKTFGAFHAAVEVYGEEWSFYKQDQQNECGICRSRRARIHPFHVYRQSVNLGTTPWRDWEVWNLIRQDLIPEWPSSRYNLIHANCIHFCDEMLKLLGAKPVPPWVRGLHETGAALFRVPWPLSLLVGSGDNEPAALPEPPDPPDDGKSGVVGREEEEARARSGFCDFNIEGGRWPSKQEGDGQAAGAAAPQEDPLGAWERQEGGSAGSTAVLALERLRPQFLPQPLPQEEAGAAAAAGKAGPPAPPVSSQWRGVEGIPPLQPRGAEAARALSRSSDQSDGEGSAVSFASLDAEDRRSDFLFAKIGSEGA